VGRQTTEEERVAHVRCFIGQDTTDEQVAAALPAQWNDSANDCAVAMGG